MVCASVSLVIPVPTFLLDVVVLIIILNLFACCQLVEECYPPNALSPEEELDVAFSSFPDSMSQGSTHASVHDCAFFFRIRRRGTIPAPNPAPPRRTTSHPSSDTFVEAVDDTGEYHVTMET